MRPAKLREPETELYECGVDYITATATHSRFQRPLLAIGKELVEEEASCGNEVRKWQGLGYHGQFAGSASYGVGSQGVLVRASSGVAAEHWREMVQWSTNVTRIDLQATVRVKSGLDSYLEKRWQEARKHWLAHKHLREPRLRSGVSGAETIELGSRTSERCGRIYDKGKETKLDHYRGCVRWEAEFKGAVSKAIAHSLVGLDRASVNVLPYVLAFFRKQRVDLEIETSSPTFIKGCAKNSDRRRKLIYLERSIRPLVNRLINQGNASEVFQALGLSEWTTLDRAPSIESCGPPNEGE